MSYQLRDEECYYNSTHAWFRAQELTLCDGTREIVNWCKKCGALSIDNYEPKGNDNIKAGRIKFPIDTNR